MLRLYSQRGVQYKYAIEKKGFKAGYQLRQQPDGKTSPPTLRKFKFVPDEHARPAPFRLPD
jgi:hypothetical protein